MQEARLRPEDAADQHFFGWSLAYDAAADRLLVGALAQEAQARGAAYVYHRVAPGQWERETRFDAGADAAPRTQLGTAVAWLDGLALVGAPGAGGFAGKVRTYERNAMTGAWTQGVTLSAHDRRPGGSFGASLTPRDDGLWVGAPGADRAGSLYRLGWDGASGQFTDVTKVAGLDREPGDGFGGVVAFDGDLAVVGQPADDYRLGSVIVLSRGGDGWRADAKLIGETPSSLSALAGADIRCAEDTADQFPCSNVDILSFLPVAEIGGGRGVETNDVWGWTDPQSGREYALVGRTDGTAFIDVTDANHPRYLGNLPKDARLTRQLVA